MTAQANTERKPTVLITGGASGIGASCAAAFADRGALVVIADRDLQGAEAVANSLRGLAVEVDITDEKSVTEAVTGIEQRCGGIDSAVLSAGIAQFPSRPEEYAIDDWQRIVDVDLRGAYLSAVALGRGMSIRGSGSIVFIASISGMRSVPLHAYGPSKAAVIAMTGNLASEWGRSGVRVNCISPGYTLTPLLRAMIDRGERDPALMEGESALGRMVTPEDIAATAVFLSSEQAQAITGVNIPVDAGWLCASSWRTYGGLPAPRSSRI